MTQKACFDIFFGGQLIGGMMAQEFGLLFLDLETTGHDPLKLLNANTLVPWHEIIDIGALLVDSASLEIHGKFSAKVIPKHPERCLQDLINDYPLRAGRGEWAHAMPLGLAIHSFLRWPRDYSESIVIPGGQNFFFDWSFLTVAFAWCGIDETEWKKYLHYTRFDTRSMAIQELAEPFRPYDPSDYSLRSDKLSKRLGIPPEPHPHEALNGAMQSYLVYRCLQEIKAKRFDDGR